MKTLLAILLTAALATGCAKKESDPQPTQAAVQAEMTRTFTFPNNSNFDAGLSYTQHSMSVVGRQDAKELLLAFDVPEGNDHITFKIPSSALSANLLGTYLVRDRQNSAATVVETQYSYTSLRVPGSTSGQLYFSSNNSMVGKVVIAAYDSQRRLLAGSFEMVMNGVNDPRERFPSTTPAQCNVKVVGKFEGLKLE